jgi:hypothetical protein
MRSIRLGGKNVQQLSVIDKRDGGETEIREVISGHSSGSRRGTDLRRRE